MLSSHQEAEIYTSPNSSEATVYMEASNVSNETAPQLNIDFDNIENILDFNVCPLPELEPEPEPEPEPAVVVNNDIPRQRPPRLRRITAEEAVPLLELQPVIYKLSREQSHKGKVDYDEKKFRCSICGHGFMRSSNLHRHMRIHTGDKPYSCQICRQRFSRSDYKEAHVKSHYNKKMQCCCICSKVYLDLTRFVDHCRLHDESDYISVAVTETANEANFKNQVQIAEDGILASTYAEQLMLSSCARIEKIDNSYDEDSVVYVGNPIRSSRRSFTNCQFTYVVVQRYS